MKKFSSTKSFLKFHTLFYLCFISISVLGLKSGLSNTSYLFYLLGYIYLVMLVFGLYIITFIYGVIFQINYKCSHKQIIGLTILLFFLTALAFSVWLPPFPLLDNLFGRYKSDNWEHLFLVSLLQGVSYYLGACLICLVQYLNLKNN